MSNRPYTVNLPQKLRSSVVFASPHSGRTYDHAFIGQSILDYHQIRSSEDAFVDHLYDVAPIYGVPFLQAEYPRAYLDLNRSPDELDPALIKGVTQRGQNPRVASGLGVIPRVVAGGRAIYRGKLSKAEADQRISGIWHPYHSMLKQLLDQAHCAFGQAILIDCHSMPHEAVHGMPMRGRSLPEVVLGDRFGAAASGHIVDRIEAAFEAVGLRVARNSPFAGAYITQTYGRPSRNQHAIQIEIDRSIYMDEATIRPKPEFTEVQRILRRVVAEIVDIGIPEEKQLAAE